MAMTLRARGSLRSRTMYVCGSIHRRGVSSMSAPFTQSRK